MRGLLAHLWLFGRHGLTAWIDGFYWRYCAHRSHRWRLKCWRWEWHDGYCGKHNGSCWGECPTEE